MIVSFSMGHPLELVETKRADIYDKIFEKVFYFLPLCQVKYCSGESKC